MVADESPVLYRHASTALAEHANGLTTRANAVTVPVYLRDENDKARLIGSAILLAIDGARFVITAGHVLDDMLKRDSAIPFLGSLLLISGTPTRLRTPDSTKPEGDRFDLGFVRLAGPSWDSAELSNFLALDEVAFDLPLAPRDSFAVIGYPATKQRRGRTQYELKSAAYR